jgi:hypothetical protein
MAGERASARRGHGAAAVPDPGRRVTKIILAVNLFASATNE